MRSECEYSLASGLEPILPPVYCLLFSVTSSEANDHPLIVVFVSHLGFCKERLLALRPLSRLVHLVGGPRRRVCSVGFARTYPKFQNAPIEGFEPYFLIRRKSGDTQAVCYSPYRIQPRKCTIPGVSACAVSPGGVLLEDRRISAVQAERRPVVGGGSTNGDSSPPTMVSTSSATPVVNAVISQASSSSVRKQRRILC